MKKTISLANMEIAKAAIKDAKTFGIEATLETSDSGEISVAYDSQADCSMKKEYASMEDVQYAMRSWSNEMSYEMKYIKEDMKYARDEYYKHLKGHLPAIKDSALMQKAIDALGLGESYNVVKPTIYVEY
jgi:hypothetical protein